MKLGIVGLPNVGKSTLFNALTDAGAQAANYPFCTIEPNVGIVPVPDRRLEALAAVYDPLKVTPAVIEFVDIAGLVRGASKGEGLGNKFLSHIREVDAVVHVVRCFESDDIVHVEGDVDPLRDIETIDIELILSDMAIVERRIEQGRKTMKGDRGYADELAFLRRLYAHLEQGEPARSMVCSEDERAVLDGLTLVSEKPVIYACNLSEEDFSAGVENNVYFRAVNELSHREGAEVLPVCAQLEQEIVGMTDDEKREFLSELSLQSSGLDRLIRSCYHLLGLISYLTAGKQEVRAWTIRRATKAPQAAGKIHSDFERGFIRAEIIGFEEFMQCGSMSAAREKGLVRSEGKEYIVQDGDIVLFRFNV